jgi:hypothetical protein
MMTMIRMLMGCFLVFAIGVTCIKFGVEFGRGYDYLPHWFAANVWLVVGVFFMAWLVTPFRQWQEAAGFVILMLTPAVVYMLTRGMPSMEATAWAVDSGLQKAGMFFAYGASAMVLVYVGYALFARLRFQSILAKYASHSPKQ